MWVISRKKLRQFWAAHEDAQVPLEFWFTIAEQARWASFHDVRNTFGRNVDRYGECYIFDVHGNTYRVIAKISKSWKKVWVRQILTHQVYDRGKWKADC